LRPDVFSPFDPTVHEGGQWSAVYLWRNGKRDDAKCAAFPAAAAAVDSLQHGAFGSRKGRGGGGDGNSGGSGGGGRGGSGGGRSGSGGGSGSQPFHKTRLC